MKWDYMIFRWSNWSYFNTLLIEILVPDVNSCPFLIKHINISLIILLWLVPFWIGNVLSELFLAINFSFFFSVDFMRKTKNLLFLLLSIIELFKDSISDPYCFCSKRDTYSISVSRGFAILFFVSFCNSLSKGFICVSSGASPRIESLHSVPFVRQEARAIILVVEGSANISFRSNLGWNVWSCRICSVVFIDQISEELLIKDSIN